jgi:hypothetical protein
MKTDESVVWRRSPRCDTGDCVETALIDGGVGVRDSKDPDGVILRFELDEWELFAASARKGVFD